MTDPLATSNVASFLDFASSGRWRNCRTQKPREESSLSRLVFRQNSLVTRAESVRTLFRQDKITFRQGIRPDAQWSTHRTSSSLRQLVARPPRKRTAIPLSWDTQMFAEDYCFCNLAGLTPLRTEMGRPLKLQSPHRAANIQISGVQSLTSSQAQYLRHSAASLKIPPPVFREPYFMITSYQTSEWALTR